MTLKNTMNYTITLVFGFLLTAAVTSRADVAESVQSDSAHEAVELATADVLELIKAGQAYVGEDPERFYVEVEALLRPLIDFKRFARNVMGVHYKVADAAQRERFAESFKWSLVRTYAVALTEFRDGTVAVLPPRKKPRSPDRADVTQEITYQGSTYVVVYKMRRSASQAWQVQNIVIEGVNIGLNYKTQFAAAMKDPEYGGDMDKVISAWTDFINQNEETG
ncbi:MAG: ABC transporter substrate-binding protein [Pseudomonadota bacterium]